MTVRRRLSGWLIENRVDCVVVMWDWKWWNSYGEGAVVETEVNEEGNFEGVSELLREPYRWETGCAGADN